MGDRRTLNELDPPAWDRPSSDDTHLVRRCIYLRQIPLADFDVEDLRMMIGQQISLRFLVPRAIDVLERNPLAEGDMYPGDLLHAVLRVDTSYWQANVEQWQSIEGIAEGLTSAVDHLRASIEAFRTQTL